MVVDRYDPTTNLDAGLQQVQYGIVFGQFEFCVCFWEYIMYRSLAPSVVVIYKIYEMTKTNKIKEKFICTLIQFFINFSHTCKNQT